LGDYYASLVARLEALYARKPVGAELEAGRREVAAWARSQLQGPIGSRLRTFRIGRLTERPINNAQLIGARIYRTRLDLFQQWYEEHDRDIGESVRALETLMAGVQGDSAYARLEKAVGG
jgi:hypothetical protein